MGLLEAIILGIIQGLTEFLPVSSSGHLELAKALMGDDLDPEQGLLFTIILHAATALSTLVIFRKDVINIFKGLLSFQWNEELKFSLKIVLSMIPAAFVGFFFESEIDGFFGGKIVLVGCMLLLTGLLLLLADRAKNTTRGVDFPKALLIGIAQAIAILPGISRSGATISTSVILGVDRSKAARFSFLMVVPLILGAMVVKVKEYNEIKSFAHLSVYERAEIAVSEVSAEGFLNASEKEELNTIIAGKEQAWDKLKSEIENEQASAAYSSLLSQFETALVNSQLSTETQNIAKTNDFSKVRSLSKNSSMALLLGFIAAFVTGLFACQWMIALVKRSKLVYFSIYCFAVGALAIGLGMLG